MPNRHACSIARTRHPAPGAWKQDPACGERALSVPFELIGSQHCLNDDLSGTTDGPRARDTHFSVRKLTKRCVWARPSCLVTFFDVVTHVWQTCDWPVYCMYCQCMWSADTLPVFLCIGFNKYNHLCLRVSVFVSLLLVALFPCLSDLTRSALIASYGRVGYHRCATTACNKD